MPRIVALMLMFLSQASLAALPPRAQNAKDLDVMVAFIKSHERVMATLDAIDLRSYTIHYQGECQATFGRKLSIRPPGWVGPAAPLEFKHATCPVD